MTPILNIYIYYIR